MTPIHQPARTHRQGAPARPAHVGVIGGGPAGLIAAELLANAGLQVTVFDAMPSVGRKFLLAGRGGLNLTHG
ncbi:MAG: NAD(P)/FAD-dependent oxidoreductase, partial [Pseudomonadales bacterium]|nr:NAD(P)/FAD-dependent oxidoreductase [Pseudomonadales bacterium]